MIKFGTDGWRAVIAGDFTFDNVRILTQATADYLNSRKEIKRRPHILIGYDTRFLSSEYARSVAEVLCANKIKTLLVRKATPTPVISFSIVSKALDGAILVTASHNPPQFNGIKFRAHFGGSPDISITKKIEARLHKSKVRTLDLEEAGRKKLFKYVDDLDSDYRKFLSSYVDIKSIKNSNLKVLIDPMFGAGIGYLEGLLGGGKIKIETIHSSLNPSFEGISPEPIEKNLTTSMKKVKKEDFDICIATDGDADRAGIIDERGVFINPQQVFMLLFLHLIEDKLMRGDLARTISATNILDRIAQKFNLGVYETAVGFKYIAQIMRSKNILIGGEESGGYGFKDYIPERDGILTGLLLLEMMVQRKKKISTILKSIEDMYGRSRYLRRDIHFTSKQKEKLINKIKRTPPKKLASKALKKIQTFDGIKFTLLDDSWLLLRFSGTEPLLRIYAESESFAETKRLIKAGLNLTS